MRLEHAVFPTASGFLKDGVKQQCTGSGY